MTEASPTSRARSFIWVGVAYALAFAVGAALIALLGNQLGSFWAAAVADVAATLVIFGFSRALSCSSIYDPYWSLAPIPIVLFWLITPQAEVDAVRAAAVAFLVSWWGLRLTWNWARGWPGLHHEDWRYVEMRQVAGRFEIFADFFGIHLFPTVQVFLGLSGAWLAIGVGVHPLSWVDALALIVTAGAITIETVADQQLRAFVQTRQPGEIMARGVWAYSRHPNYFGELSFWWGLFLFGVAAAPSHWWWTIAGPVAMTGMFLGVSVPWLDRRSIQRRPAYADHMRRVSRLVPWFPKRSADA